MDGGEESFREQAEGGFHSLGAASGLSHTGAVHRASAGLLWTGLPTHPSRSQAWVPQGRLLDISHLAFLGTAIVLTAIIPKPQQSQNYPTGPKAHFCDSPLS